MMSFHTEQCPNVPELSPYPRTLKNFGWVLIILQVSLSPIWGQISFLDVSYKSGGVLHYGVFGPTGGPQSIGYHFNSEGFTKKCVFHLLCSAGHPTKAVVASLRRPDEQ